MFDSCDPMDCNPPGSLSMEFPWPTRDALSGERGSIIWIPEVHLFVRKLLLRYLVSNTIKGLPGGSEVKNLPAVQETWIWSLEKEIATHSSSLAWEILWQRGLVGNNPWRQKSQTLFSTWTTSNVIKTPETTGFFKLMFSFISV